MARLLFRVAFGIIFLSFIYPYLQGRFRVASVLLNNRPGELRQVNALPNYAVKFADRIRNCEDALIVEEDAVAILSCDPGRDRWNTVMGTFNPDQAEIPNGQLWVYRYTLPDDAPHVLVPITIADYPGDFSLHPLGVEYHRPSATLFVVNHHVQGSRVDVFALDDGLSSSPDGHAPLVARHTASLRSPLLQTPNAVTALSAHALYVTNDHSVRRKDHPWLYQAETYSAFPGGSVAYVDLATSPPQIRRVARVNFANGVAVLDGGSTLAVSSTATARVRLYDILPDRSLRSTDEIRVPFMPDNLSVDGDGTLLIAGHPFSPGLEEMVAGRRVCTREKGIEAVECWKANAPTYAAEWTRAGGVQDLYVSQGEFGTGATAVRDATRGVGLISGLYEAGVLVWGGKYKK